MQGLAALSGTWESEHTLTLPHTFLNIPPTTSPPARPLFAHPDPNMAFIEKKTGNKKYGFEWRVDGKKKRKFFASKTERKDFADGLKNASKADRELFADFDPAKYRRFLELEKQVAPATLEDAVKAFTANNPAYVTKTLKVAITEYEDSMNARRVAESNQHHVKLTLERIESWFGGEKDLAAITTDELQEWFNSWNKSATTLKNYHKHLRAFFRWHQKRGAILRIPTENIELPKVIMPEPEIIPVEDLEAFFTANREIDPGICGLMALGAFAGLRTSSIYRLEAKDINFEEKTIMLPAEKLKTARRHLVEGLEDNIWPWLKLLDERDLDYPKLESEFQRKKRRLDERRKRACIRANVTFPHNGLRHSFITYFSALNGSAEKAAYIAGHRDARITWEHYKGLATKADAKRYFSI